MGAETKYKNEVLIPNLKRVLPGCFIQENDPKVRQGMPDLLILWGPHWAMLEVKASRDSPVRPNQPYWVEFFSTMSFSAFVYPENEEDVINAIQQAFGT